MLNFIFNILIYMIIELYYLYDTYDILYLIFYR